MSEVAAANIEFKGRIPEPHKDFVAFMTRLLGSVELGKTIFVYTQSFYRAGHVDMANKILLRGIVDNKVVFKAQGKSRQSCYRGKIFCAAHGAEEVYKRLGQDPNVLLQDVDDLSDKAENLAELYEAEGKPMTQADINEMLGIQTFQNFLNGRPTEIKQLRGIVQALGICSNQNHLARKFCDEFLTRHPAKGYAPTRKLAHAMRDLNLFARLRSVQFTAAALRMHAEVAVELKGLESSDVAALSAANDAELSLLREQIQALEVNSKRLADRQRDEDSRRLELQAVKEILMDLLPQ